MAYKLNSSGYYVGSDGKKYDAASGWSVSKDGKTLTNSYTGNTVSDVGSSGSTTNKTSTRTATTTPTTSTANTLAGTSSKTSPRTVTYTSGNSGSSKNTSNTISQATQAVQNSTPAITWTVQDKPTYSASTAPQTNNSLAGITDQASALAAMMGNSQAWNGSSTANQNALADLNSQIASQWFPGATRENGEWYYNGTPLYNQSFAGGQGGVTNQMSSGESGGVNYLGPSENGDEAWSAFAREMGLYPRTAYAFDGSTYNVESAKGLLWLQQAKPGDSMITKDGAKWTVNEGGSVTIQKDGKTYTEGGGLTGIYPEPFEFTPFEQTEMGQTLMQDYQQLMDKIQNYDPFTYDPNTDPLYLQYADSYTRGGQRAMTDILGQLAARTGGMASSYAGSMAQQTYDQYMADLASKIPELQQLAYSMYMDQYNRDVGNYERMYGQFQDAYNRNAQDTQFRYNQYQDEIANRWKNLYNTQDMYQQSLQNYNAAQQWEAQKAAAERANRIEDEEIAYSREQDRIEREDRLAEQAANRADALREQIYNMVLNDGYRITPEDKVRYGLTDSEYNNLAQYANDWWRSKSDKWAIF